MVLPEPDDVKRRALTLLDALKDLLSNASDKNLRSLYRILLDEPLLAVADKFQAEAASRLLPDYGKKMAEVGRYFAVRADHREAVKFGILLLGVAGTREDTTQLETLALHDEFTLYAAMAIANLVDDRDDGLWSLAKRVRGWGRVQVVERLSGTTRPAIQAWMLREGFRNEVMDEYLACICAKTAKLHEALISPDVDSELLNGAAGIIRALLAGGPAESIDDYQDAPTAIRLYVGLVLTANDLGLDHFLCISRILQFLSTEEGWESRFSKGWTGQLRDRLRAECQIILSRETWRPQVYAGLKSDEFSAFDTADSAAQELGIDTWNVHFAKVRAAPMKSVSWYRLLQQTDESRIDEVLDFAAKALPLDTIATGPDTHMGVGPGFEAHRALDWLLQDLDRFPGRGWALIKAGLRSPVVRNRNMALKALLAWRREQWPQEAQELLRQAVLMEPNEDLRARIETLAGPRPV